MDFKVPTPEPVDTDTEEIQTGGPGLPEQGMPESSGEGNGAG